MRRMSTQRPMYLLFSLLVSAMLLTGCVVGDAPVVKSEAFRVTMLDVGQGLSVLVEDGDHAMLYDGGGRTTSSYVSAYLKEHRNRELDYMIVSHYDEDHLAGLVGVLNTVDVETAIIPQYEADTKIYQSFMSALECVDTVTFAQAGDSFHLGDTTIDILYACQGTEESENAMSTVVKVSCGDFSLMLTGDAEKNTEKGLVQSGVDLESTLYIVGHHGSNSSSSEEFVEAMHPEIAFISVGANNKYGHPTEKVLNLFDSYGILVCRTDLLGTVILDYDGNDYTIFGEDGKIVSKKTADPAKVSEKSQGEYILNTSTMKIHLPGCSAVEKIADYNKAYSSELKEKLIDAGYTCCGICMG